MASNFKLGGWPIGSPIHKLTWLFMGWAKTCPSRDHLVMEPEITPRLSPQVCLSGQGPDHLQCPIHLFVVNMRRQTSPLIEHIPTQGPFNYRTKKLGMV